MLGYRRFTATAIVRKSYVQVKWYVFLPYKISIHEECGLIVASTTTNSCIKKQLFFMHLRSSQWLHRPDIRGCESIELIFSANCTVSC